MLTILCMLKAFFCKHPALPEHFLWQLEHVQPSYGECKSSGSQYMSALLASDRLKLVDKYSSFLGL